MSRKTKFWLITLGSVLTGGVVGFLSSYFFDQDGKRGPDSSFALKWYIAYPYDVVFYVMALICVGLLIAVVGGMAKWPNIPKQTVDDELYSPAENALGRLFSQASMMFVVAIVWLFCIGIYPYEVSPQEETYIIVLTISSIIFTVIGWLFMRNVLKKINEFVPRLAIDLYDASGKQARKMEERLDEFERLSMYKAGYITMNWMMSVMAILGFGIFLYSLIIEPQMNLLLLVGVLYILLSYKYFRVSNQLMHGSKSKQNKGEIA